MTKIFNNTSEKQKRQRLRRNQTKAEVILWSKLRNCQIEGYKFRRQYSIYQFVVDFYCPTLKLAIEVDGDSHFQQGVVKYDRERQKLIESVGIQFLRFTNEEIYQNLDGVIEVIRQQALTPLDKGGN